METKLVEKEATDKVFEEDRTKEECMIEKVTHT
jgi:hypothetical protein